MHNPTKAEIKIYIDKTIKANLQKAVELIRQNKLEEAISILEFEINLKRGI